LSHIHWAPLPHHLEQRLRLIQATGHPVVAGDQPKQRPGPLPWSAAVIMATIMGDRARSSLAFPA
jgi:hypothetical protein